MIKEAIAQLGCTIKHIKSFRKCLERAGLCALSKYFLQTTNWFPQRFQCCLLVMLEKFRRALDKGGDYVALLSICQKHLIASLMI